jgi:[protein-PII] uridylyltransferase
VARAPGAAGVARLDVALPDRIGVLATVAGVLSLRHVRILAAEVETISLTGESGVEAEPSAAQHEPWAVQRWTVAAQYGELPDIARLRTDLRAALAGRLDLAARVASREAEHRPVGGRAWASVAPTVSVLEGASAAATVIEVRASDTPGLLHRVAAAIAQSGADITTARVATLGAEAIDVFYITDASGSRLSADHAEQVAGQIRTTLGS